MKISLSGYLIPSGQLQNIFIQESERERVRERKRERENERDHEYVDQLVVFSFHLYVERGKKRRRRK